MAKTAFITGASSGIGLATAQGLAKAGFDLMLLARRRDPLEALAKEAREMGRQVKIFTVDIRNREQIDDLVQSEASNL